MRRWLQTLVAWSVPAVMLLVPAGLLCSALEALADSHRLAELLLSVVTVSSLAWLTGCR